MEPHLNGNGRHAPEQPGSLGKPYFDAVSGEEPPEIVDYERATNPYANMLPGISSINAARTLGQGVGVGRRGRPVIMIVSLILIAVLVLPAVLAVLSQVVH